jgi:putative PIN family toxin of toxin-antitoxin system
VRLVLDTNILISSLLTPGGRPRQLYGLWLAGAYQLVTSPPQLAELRRVMDYPKIVKRTRPADTDKMIEQLRDSDWLVDQLPDCQLSPDPMDNLILATAMAGDADAVVTGDRRHLLSVASRSPVPIVTVVEALLWIAGEEAVPR